MKTTEKRPEGIRAAPLHLGHGLIRLVAFVLLLALPFSPLQADPVRYGLDVERSTVAFIYRFQGRQITGSMPVSQADIRIDFSDVRATSARVSLNAARARAGFVFATDAMRGPQVLDTARHPTIAFASSRVRPNGRGATMEGQLTVRGVTRPVRLTARFAEDGAGGDPGARDWLVIQLRGQISRAAFGATGFPSYVGDPIDIVITAALRRQP